MSRYLIILKLLLAQTPWHGDAAEPPAERQERLEEVAQAIDHYAKSSTEAIRLLVQGTEETHWARHIQEGRCGQHPKAPPNECDALKQRVKGDDGVWRRVWVPQSVSPFQVKKGYTRQTEAAWKQAAKGREGIRAATWLALYYLRKTSCGGRLEHSYRAADGKGCDLVTPYDSPRNQRGRKRAALHRRMAAKWYELSRKAEP